jgi:hypothetical protein
MKLRFTDQLGLLLRDPRVGPAIKQDIRKMHLPMLAKAPHAQALALGERILALHLDDALHTDYLLTATAWEMAQQVRITDKFDYRLLDTLPRQSSSYLLGRGRTFRFTVEDDAVYCFYLDYDWDTTELTYEMFRIDTTEGFLSGISPRARELAEQLIRAMIFVNLGEVDFLLVPPGRKVGTRATGYKSEVPFPVKVVDSSWNRYTIRTAGFAVSGHLRLQPHGPGGKLRKIIWVEGYTKKGYVRAPRSGRTGLEDEDRL